MIQLLADVNIEGHVGRLLALMQDDYWKEYWTHLDLRERRFADVGLLPFDTDTVSSADRILASRDYAERVIESLIDQLQRIDTLRGTGRLYLP